MRDDGDLSMMKIHCSQYENNDEETKTEDEGQDEFYF
jgi:hypothetical protein